MSLYGDILKVSILLCFMAKGNKKYENHKFWKVRFTSAEIDHGYDSNNKADPYVRIGKKGKIMNKWLFQTRVKEATLSPKWDQETRIVVSPKNPDYIIEIWDQDPIKDDFIGFAEIKFPVQEELQHLVLNDRSGKKTAVLIVSIEEDGWFRP
ncbi:hypothetical protein CYY_004110 [Polysphondylium violaceum]|uniref:C2 domain-containing protein n=1 Tax=Polysphondylium violaceum TaxID=133409 RepID=A0A8J4PV52_9MYCE|nr:hypothetical protein CYY_004110 [Polysphondylium violaceum]